MGKESVNGILDAALEISARRAETLSRMRHALEQGDESEALSLAKELVGIDDEQKSNRIDTSVN